MRIVGILSLLALIAGCTASKTEEDSGAGGSGEATTNCGVVINGEIYETVDLEDGIPVSVRYDGLGSNQVIVELSDGSLQLVKLAGVGDIDPTRQEAARSALSSLAGQGTYFYPAGDDCTVAVSGGGIGTVGQIITRSGQSFSEALVQRGLAPIVSEEPCGSAEYAQCLAALGDSNPVTAGALDAFLWKPVSDSNGKLAIHTGPYDTIVIVNGEVGENSGPGNGYGSLARFSKPGCGYSTPQIQVVDNQSGLRYEVGGVTTFTVPNPCGRHCLVDGEIRACSK
jgi:hypothetical protein